MAENIEKLLDKIIYPSDLKKLSEFDLIQVSKELREFIIDAVSTNPGHFGASLGAVEIAVALHYVFNAPYDQIVWDVGHQAYAHKILTGRKTVFNTNRKYKGISGFPKRSESEYDAFGVGHSSTSISAALGMAAAASLKNEKSKHVIAVIGDGALTGGESFEGLNNAGILNTNILVILNDNNMAIDPNVGGFNEYLIDIATSRMYNKLKDDVWNVLGKLKKFGPNAQGFIQKIDNGIKAILFKQSNMFEAIGFRYFGPVDGHDVVHLAKILNDLKDIPGPKILHCLTTKGKGFKPAEQNQTAWHAPGLFNKETGKKIHVQSDKPTPPRYQDVFGNTIVELAEKNPKIIGVTPAMPTGCSLNIMMKKMPDRAFDVGIAEQHAVTFSAGLATQGLTPFCNIYSTFMQRGYDQVIHDVALQKLNVVFCLDRGGLVGDDGATHHGAFDLAYMRCIPNMIVSAPMNEIELRNLMFTAQQDNMGPFVIRYPRGKGVTIDWQKPMKAITVGTGRLIHKGNDVAVLTIGHVGNFVVDITKKLSEENINIAHYDMRFVKPIDNNILHLVFNNFKHIITVEDGTVIGGFGSAVVEFMNENNYSANIIKLGVPDRFIEQGSQKELYKECGYDAESIYNTIKSIKF